MTQHTLSGSKCVLVLGPPRSGTSAAAGALQVLGVDLGSSLRPANDWNPKGSFEHREVFKLQEGLLNNFGSAHADPRPLPSDWQSDPHVAVFEQKLRELVSREFGSSKLWAVKDPPSCIFLPCWHRVLAELEVNPGFMLVLRRPASSIGSLSERAGLSATEAALLWLRYMLQAEAGTRGRQRALVRYERLLTSAMEEIDRVAAALNVRWPRAGEANKALSSFLTPALSRHEHEQLNEVEEPIRGWVESVHDTLTKQELGDSRCAGALDSVAEAMRVFDCYAEACWSQSFKRSQHALERTRASRLWRLGRGLRTLETSVRLWTRRNIGRSKE